MHNRADRAHARALSVTLEETRMTIELSDETMTRVMELARLLKMAPPKMLSRIVRDLFADEKMQREIAQIILDESTPVLN